MVVWCGEWGSINYNWIEKKYPYWISNAWCIFFLLCSKKIQLIKNVQPVETVVLRCCVTGVWRLRTCRHLTNIHTVYAIYQFFMYTWANSRIFISVYQVYMEICLRQNSLKYLNGLQDLKMFNIQTQNYVFKTLVWYQLYIQCS